MSNKPDRLIQLAKELIQQGYGSTDALKHAKDLISVEDGMKAGKTPLPPKKEIIVRFSADDYRRMMVMAETQIPLEGVLREFSTHNPITVGGYYRHLVNIFSSGGKFKPNPKSLPAALLSMTVKRARSIASR